MTRKIAYPLIGTALAALSTAFLFFSLSAWAVCALGANILIGAGIVLNASSGTVKVPDGTTRDVTRIPTLPLILSVLAASLVGFFTGNMLPALGALLSWGFPVFPLALCVLQKYRFSSAMQRGLLWAAIAGLCAAAAQIFLTSPGFSFKVKYCLDLLAETLKNAMLSTMEQLSEMLRQAGQDPAVLTEQLGGEFSDVAGQISLLMISMIPALFAIAALVVCCLDWWGMKSLLLYTDHPAGDMGRIPDFSVPRGILPAYFLAYLVSILSEADSVFRIASVNLVWILSGILAYGGYAFLWFLGERKIASSTVRKILAVVVLLLGLTGLGSTILVFLGIFGSGRELHEHRGGKRQ